MRPHYVLAALVILVAWDLVLNDANVFWTINAYVDDLMRYLHLS